MFAIADDGTPTGAAGADHAGRPDGHGRTGTRGRPRHRLRRRARTRPATTPACSGVTAASRRTRRSARRARSRRAHTYAAGRHVHRARDRHGTRSRALETTFKVTVQAAPSPAITVAPNAAPGKAMTLTGTGFAAGERVNVKVDGAPSAASTVTASPNGTIAATLTLPPSAGPGRYAVVASGAASGTPAAATVDVAPATAPAYQPQVTLTPSSGPHGSLLSLAGNGFAPRELLTITFRSAANTLATQTIHANGQGILDGASMSVPDIAEIGAAQVTVTRRGFGHAGLHAVRGDDGRAERQGLPAEPEPDRGRRGRRRRRFRLRAERGCHRSDRRRVSDPDRPGRRQRFVRRCPGGGAKPRAIRRSTPPGRIPSCR